MRFSKAPVILFAFFIAAPAAVAQPTRDILGRVLMVQSQNERGTIFSLDVDQREYWITAKHILTHAKHPPFGSITNKSVLLRILNPGAQGEQWISVKFSLIDPGNDIDVVVLAAQQLLLKNPLPSVTADSTGAMLGGDCEFLGFPFGGGWRANFAKNETSWMPFVKRCTISALANEGSKIWILDGINNGGFSGGPVYFGTGLQLKIFGVVSGYWTEPADVTAVIPAAVPPNVKVNVNAGFFSAFDIRYAIDAIHKRPIGPMRKGS